MSLLLLSSGSGVTMTVVDLGNAVTEDGDIAILEGVGEGEGDGGGEGGGMYVLCIVFVQRIKWIRITINFP